MVPYFCTIIDSEILEIVLISSCSLSEWTPVSIFCIWNMCICRLLIILKWWSVTTAVPSHSLHSPFNPQFWIVVIFRYMTESRVNHDFTQERQLKLVNYGLSEIILREESRKFESICRNKKALINIWNIIGNREKFAILCEDIINWILDEISIEDEANASLRFCRKKYFMMLINWNGCL